MKRVKKMLCLLLVLLLLCLTLTVCGAANQEKDRLQAMYGENHRITEAYDETLAATCFNGTFVGKPEGDVLSFKGIPYAVPPLGALRWKDPVPAKKSSSVYEAYYFGASPVQTEWPSEVGSYYPQSENCLTLNVWTNPKGPKSGKTVMVFFHGGSYGWGAVSDPIYDGHNLVEKYPDLVLVSVEYRLGIFGFIDFSSVPGGEDYATSGNLGLLDQVCALQWVRDNIASFGGDPKNVTIFGESAGGGSVSLLPLIAGAKGLFRRIIAESGSVTLTYGKEECVNLTELLLKKSGCSTMEELTALSEKELKELNEELNDYNNFPERDGVVLPEDLYAAWLDPSLADIDLLIGTNADETRYWIREFGYYVPGIPDISIYTHGITILFENNMAALTDEETDRVNAFLDRKSEKKIWKITEFYNEMLFRVPALKQAENHRESGGRSFVYYWTQGGEDQRLGACHAIELSYVFRNPNETLYTGSRYNTALAETVQDMWVNFAKTGDPSTSEYTWEPYEPDSRRTMILGEKIYMESDPKNEERTLLEPLLGHYFNGCYAQMSLFVPQMARIILQILAELILLAALIAVPVTILQRRREKKKKK